MADPRVGDFKLQARTPKEGSQKITYSVMRYEQNPLAKAPSWRRTMFRLEWYPRLHTWRLKETVRSISKGGWAAGWKQVIVADFGDLPRQEAYDLTLATLSLQGY